eukprot:jgi/Tetstr1/460125/TSEL_005441.t1
MANAHPLLPTLGAVVGALLLVASLESVHAGGRKLLCSDMQNGVCCDTGACDGPDGSRFTGTMTVNGVKSYCYSNGQCYDNLQSGASDGSAPSTPAIDRLPADYWGSLKPFWGASPSPSASARSPSIPSIPSNCIGSGISHPVIIATMADHSGVAKRARKIGIFRFWRDLG